MRNTMVVGLAVVMATMFCRLALAAEKAPQKVIDLANGTLVQYGSDAVVVKAVKEKNAKGETLDQIKELDAKWQATAGVADFMRGIMESECGKHLHALQGSAPYLAEIFVMDQQGANVAMSDKTSDYWQGDEPKFTESYKGGAGAVHISDAKFDDSTQTYTVQVSVPVKDGDRAIGAITFGVDVDKL